MESAKLTVNQFTFADLFAGIGGMRIAFEKAGGRCVLTSEIDAMALETYKANFSGDQNHRYVNDVLKISARDFENLNSNLDVMVAGFPCQPYSIAGLRKGLQDDRGGKIFKSLLRILKSVEPQSFLLENVKGIKNHESGATFQFMLDSLSAQGFTLKYETLNSATHANVPQNRERVFIVGFRDSNVAENFNFPKKVNLTRTIHDCIIDDKADPEFYYDERYEISKSLKEQVISRDTVYQWRRQYVRENKSNLCPTLTANMGSGGHNVPIIRDRFGVRKLTPRETANFQGFPKNFTLPNIANSHLYHQFGNSVTVPLISRIATQMTAALTNFKK